jgi:hypothetical protein
LKGKRNKRRRERRSRRDQVLPTLQSLWSDLKELLQLKFSAALCTNKLLPNSKNFLLTFTFSNLKRTTKGKLSMPFIEVKLAFLSFLRKVILFEVPHNAQG